MSGLAYPTAIAFLPDGRMLVTEKGGWSTGTGLARVLMISGATTTAIASIPVCSRPELGMLGIAVDPDFPTNGYVYLYRNAPAGGCDSAAGRSNEIVRITMAADGTVDPSTLRVLLTGIRSDVGNHMGGGLRFGADGKLYVGVGDAGTGDNQGCPGTATNPYAQDLSAIEGKVLRLNRDGTIPPDNPYLGQSGARGEIFASGFRNPFRLAFDPITHNLWVGEVGDRAWEEIDIASAGGDYGWPQCEAVYPAPGCANQRGLVYYYSHGTTFGANCPDTTATTPYGSSVIGGAFATGAFSGRRGHYFFGDFSGRGVYDAEPTATRAGITGAPTTFVANAGNPVDVAFACNAVFYVSIFDGEVRRVAPMPTGTDTPLAGKRLLLSDQAGARIGKRLSVRSTDAALTLGGGNGSADDPVQNGGSELEVSSANFDDVYPLPEGNFRYLGAPGTNRGYRYRDRDLSEGPVKTITVKNGRLLKVVAAGGALGHTLRSNPGPVDVVLTLAGRSYSLRFGGTTRFDAGRYRAQDAPPPALCP